jgi:hypothetical protein
MSEKNTPIDTTIAEFWKVARMPAAAPRWRAGTLFMMPAMLGEKNRPPPMPLTSSRPPNCQYGKFTGSRMRPRNEAVAMSMPPVANGRAPNRSDRYPDNGPNTSEPTVSGSM